MFISGKKLEPSTPMVIANTDIIQLGVAPTPNQAPEYVWQFFDKLRVKKLKRPADKISLVSGEHKRRKNEDEKGSVLATVSPVINMVEARLEERASEEDQCQIVLREQEERLAEMAAILAKQDETQKKLQEELDQKNKLLQEEKTKKQVRSLSPVHKNIIIDVEFE